MNNSKSKGKTVKKQKNFLNEISPKNSPTYATEVGISNRLMPIYPLKTVIKDYGKETGRGRASYMKEISRERAFIFPGVQSGQMNLLATSISNQMNMSSTGDMYSIGTDLKNLKNFKDVCKGSSFSLSSEEDLYSHSSENSYSGSSSSLISSDICRFKENSDKSYVAPNRKTEFVKKSPSRTEWKPVYVGEPSFAIDLDEFPPL